MSSLRLTCSYDTDWPLIEVVRDFMYVSCHRGVSPGHACQSVSQGRSKHVTGIKSVICLA